MQNKRRILSFFVIILCVFSITMPVYGEESYLGNDEDMNLMGIDNLINLTKDIDDEVVVAVIDSGIDETIPIFNGRIDSRGKNVMGYNDNDLNDSSYHGTSICSIIADCTPDNVKILPIKVSGTSRDEIDYDIVKKGILYAIECNVDVINLSILYQIGKQQECINLSEEINMALQKNIIICVAAGNYDTNSKYSVPSNHYGVFSVTSFDNKGGQLIRSSYANYGQLVNGAAPGKVKAYYRIGGIIDECGTSFSAPYFSSIAAMLKLVDNNIDINQFNRILHFNNYIVDDGEFNITYRCPNFSKLNIELIKFEIYDIHKIKKSRYYTCSF